MDSSFEDSSVRCEPEEAGVAHGAAAAADGKAARLSPSPASTSSPKRSRRSVQKRVVSVPIAEADASRPKGAGEGAPPSDSWAWRKYGQKPIKGSPYPRGYYRCSSSKGCPARKQVERSRVDPTMLVITYSSDHNHAWPLPKHHHHHSSAAAAADASTSPKAPPEEEPSQVHPSPPDPSDQDERFSDLIADETSSLMMADEFGWFSDVGSSSSTSPPEAAETLFYAPPIYGGAAMLCADECERLGGGGAKEEEEEDSLFAGLGELPEFSMVFRRGLAAAAAASTG